MTNLASLWAASLLIKPHEPPPTSLSSTLISAKTGAFTAKLAGLLTKVLTVEESHSTKETAKPLSFAKKEGFPNS
ncbi:hypothetical protein L484_017167 [Morus notabilis]|uniref:Uncharacterized protein n=1 Tax=Morus notabilis TaxID=981085 RepID=W9QVD3_9ROSA|nr:hypothetical protein L484_017167 [Morus notabilis]